MCCGVVMWGYLTLSTLCSLPPQWAWSCSALERDFRLSSVQPHLPAGASVGQHQVPARPVGRHQVRGGERLGLTGGDGHGAQVLPLVRAQPCNTITQWEEDGGTSNGFSWPETQKGRLVDTKVQTSAEGNYLILTEPAGPEPGRSSVL